MTKSCFVIMVHGDRAPLLLGPMPADMRGQHMRELRDRYGDSCGLHELDVTARSASKVTAKVKPYPRTGTEG